MVKDHNIHADIVPASFPSGTRYGHEGVSQSRKGKQRSCHVANGWAAAGAGNGFYGM